MIANGIDKEIFQWRRKVKIHWNSEETLVNINCATAWRTITNDVSETIVTIENFWGKTLGDRIYEFLLGFIPKRQNL